MVQSVHSRPHSQVPSDQMDNYWIKALGGGPRIGRIPDDWRDVDDALFERAVTFAQRSSIEPGDKICV